MRVRVRAPQLSRGVRRHEGRMELFGIVFSIPVAFVMSMSYCALLAKVVSRFEPLRRFLYMTSLCVLGLFLIELMLLVSMGAVRSRAIVGSGFYVAHLAFFFLGTPALANTLVLHRPAWPLGKWYVAALLCTGFAVFLVLLQYGVSEALYGVDGTNGPYS